MNKRHYHTILWFLALLCVACTGVRVQEGKAPEEEVEAPRKAAAVQDSTSSAESMMGDSVSPVRSLYAPLPPFTDFPCIYLPSTLLRGAETDGKGTFFFVMGDRTEELPEYVCNYHLFCFRDTTLLYRRSLGIQDLYDRCEPVTHLVGDMLWIIEKKQHLVLRLHRSGEGELARFPLPVAPTDSVELIRTTPEGYMLLTFPRDSVDEMQRPSLRRVLVCRYPVTVEREYVTDTVPEAFRPQGHGIFESFGYAGMYGGYRIFVRYFSSFPSRYIGLADKQGRLKRLHPISHVPNVPHVYPESELTIPDYDSDRPFLIRGDKLYLMNTDWSEKNVGIHEFDLRQLCAPENP